MKRIYYEGSDTKITEPFYHTKCRCGKEFLRIHRKQEIICPYCRKRFFVEEQRKAG